VHLVGFTVRMQPKCKPSTPIYLPKLHTFPHLRDSLPKQENDVY